MPIVGIGASAGGLEAFTELLHALPTTTGMAFVFIQHLDPHRESLLLKLVARETAMPVKEIVDGMQVEANSVFIVPPNHNLAVLHGTSA